MWFIFAAHILFMLITVMLYGALDKTNQSFNMLPSVEPYFFQLREELCPFTLLILWDFIEFFILYL
jgi:hypothetical protein